MTRAGLIELNAVVAVATHRSFRKAAAELGVSPSALSHAVASLEKRMGVRLFNRTTRSVTPSEAGEQFLSRVSPALSEIRDAMTGVNEFRDTPVGTIRLNASEAAAQMVLEPLVLEFLRRYPDMRVDLVTEGRLVDVVAEGFDAGIRQAEFVPLDMVAVVCSPPIRYVVVGSPRYFLEHGEPLHPNDLRGHRCIRNRLPSGALYRWEFQQGEETIAIDPSGPLTLDNYNLRISAALQGAGLTWVNAWAVSPHVASGQLIPVLQSWSTSSPGLRLYYPSQRNVPAGMKAFIALVREVYGSARSEQEALASGL
ncbi:LysR family transcriptional regulator [Rhodoferax saidenbachensis]|uniref:LysR family transcriptional regulator n=1 Tax=Rhodoferax saidenbachensis TaxID=1484693 RepID=A0A1P8KAQ2_9BURK|nr:LysR family transcriptional regulator [Rhodoferax saidenbachensis]APW43089.1 LysR family transcriptional regulator [Rhodoferax saidenbachensis]